MNFYNLGKTSRKPLWYGVALVTLAILAYPVWRTLAAAGDLDPSFSGDGKIDNTPELSLLPDLPHFQRIAIQADGKLLALTSSVYAPNSNFEIVRYNLNGTLDNTFDGDGKVVTDLGGKDQALALAVDSSGKIVVAGYSNQTAFYSESRGALVRYLPNGSLDPTFDGNGKLLGLQGYYISAVVIQPDHKIVVIGGNNTFGVIGGWHMARYNWNGSLDTTFGENGHVFNIQGLGNKVALQSDGKILVGTAGSIMRLTATGAVDATFTLAPGLSIRNFELQDDGKIVTLDYYYQVQRLLTTGLPDAPFTPLTLSPPPNPNCVAQFNTMAIQEDGRVLVAGGCRNSSTSLTPEAYVARVTSNGALDTGFGAGGYRVTNSFAFTDGAIYADLALMADGRIVTIGKAYAPPFGIGLSPQPRTVLARYKNDNTDTQTTDVGIGMITNSPTVVHPGDVVTYNIPVRNNSATKAAHVTFNSSVPGGTSFFSLSLPSGWATLAKPSSYAMGAISCSTYELAPNTTTTVQIRVAVSTSASPGQNILFSANAGNTIPDNVLNNLGVKVISVQ